MGNEFMNVKESWHMYDTILVSPFLDTFSHPVPGWYSTFAAMSQTDSLSFFDSRNKSVGLAYNNQDSRDQIPFAFVIESISVGFFAPTIPQIGVASSGEYVPGRADTFSSFWNAELPEHVSAILRVNQDERLKTKASMLPAGYGAYGNMMGQGATSDVGGNNQSVSCNNMGRAHMKYRWEFPTGIGVPRRATLAVNLQLTEWAKDVLNTLWGPGYHRMYDWDDGAITEDLEKPSCYMIQVLLSGKRQVQQRAQYHA